MSNYIKLQPEFGTYEIFVFKAHIVAVKDNTEGGCVVYINHPAIEGGHITLKNYTAKDFLRDLET